MLFSLTFPKVLSSNSRGCGDLSSGGVGFGGVSNQLQLLKGHIATDRRCDLI